MEDRLNWTCQVCGYVGLDDGSDGFFYCQRCGSQAEDIRDTAVDDDENFEGREIFRTGHCRKRHKPSAAELVSQSQPQSQPQSQYLESLGTQEVGEDAGDGVGPTGPSDFGSGLRTLSYEDFYSEIRLRYVTGVQIMIQLQCKALVEKFQVSPLIVGLVEPIWLRFVALTRIFADGWADEAIHESESQKQGQADDFEPRTKYRAEPHNILGQRAVMIWFSSLSKLIPLSYSLVISFLVCHVAREAILPTDILKWTLEGKLPYFAAFVEIEKHLKASRACPISSSCMFRPTKAVSLQKLESCAASVALTIGLELPPVNFYAIASRYLSQLSLPVGKILPHACRIYEWSMPPELWLSANELRLPTRVCVMSILMVSIRILYNINGFGKWEISLSGSSGSSSLTDLNEETEPTCNSDMDDDAKQGLPSHDLDDSGTEPSSNPSDVQHSKLDAAELLLTLVAKYDELSDLYDYSKDLPTYLQYCKDVVFSGLEPSFEDHEEEKIIEELWDFYQNKQDFKPSDDHGIGSLGGHRNGDYMRARYDIISTPKENEKCRDNGCDSSPLEGAIISLGDDSSQHSMNWENSSLRYQNSSSDGHHSAESHKDRAIRRLMSDMEDNRFYYIPPRVNVKRSDYLHYTRKKDEGAFTYAVHADYYILLRSCARVVQLDCRSMHVGVLSFERRLAWLEKRIDHCLHVQPPTDSCEFCSDEVEQNVNDEEDSMDFSQENL